jgi:tRNA threonylcarbamoyladenosine biosynthesis protein TsaE
MIVVDLPDETATAALAARIAAVAAPGDIIALKGDLGTGKTAFARAFIRARGSLDEVPSPTFTLLQMYDVDPTVIWHFDLYRLRAPEDAWELGIEDAFTAGISLIEWPERLGLLLPERRLEITFAFGDGPGERRICLDPSMQWQARLAAIAANA